MPKQPQVSIILDLLERIPGLADDPSQTWGTGDDGDGIDHGSGRGLLLLFYDFWRTLRCAPVRRRLFCLVGQGGILFP